MPETSLIQSRYDAILVYPCGKPRWHPIADPKLVKPTKARLLCEISGPPESPRHADLCCTPRAQITLFLNSKNGKSGIHWYNGIIFKSAYCKIGANVVAVVFIKPFPIMVTSKFLGAGVQANSTGLITSLNSTGLGSLINPMSLFNKFNKISFDVFEWI